jgi:hypothetical protein
LGEEFGLTGDTTLFVTKRAEPYWARWSSRMAKANVRFWLLQPVRAGIRLRLQARLKGGRWIKTMKDMGTSKNGRYSFDTTKLPANDSVSFPFRFIDVHLRAVRGRQREQFFEVPI